MKSPIVFFFEIGNKVTRGDPIRKADWDYYMMLVIFLAFFAIFIGNMRHFISTLSISSLGWAAFSIAIMWFQYFSLREAWKIRKMLRNNEKPIFALESQEGMLNQFKDG